jgi:hypothetical protein
MGVPEDVIYEALLTPRLDRRDSHAASPAQGGTHA